MKYFSISIILLLITSSCANWDAIPYDETEVWGDTWQEEIAEHSGDSKDNNFLDGELPSVFFISGIVLEPVIVGDETEFIPVSNARIELRDETRFLFAQVNTNLEGRFYIEHRNIQQGREYFIMLVTSDRRASDLFTYEFETHAEMEIIVDENFVSFRGADWDDRVTRRGSLAPPRTEQ